MSHAVERRTTPPPAQTRPNHEIILRSSGTNVAAAAILVLAVGMAASHAAKQIDELIRILSVSLPQRVSPTIEQVTTPLPLLASRVLSVRSVMRPNFLHIITIAMRS